jgi:hypothetical protein
MFKGNDIFLNLIPRTGEIYNRINVEAHADEYWEARDIILGLKE